MASTTTALFTLRVPNEDLRELHALAETLDVAPRTLGAAAIRYAISGQRRSRVKDAIALLKRSEAAGHRERRDLVLEAVALLQGDGRGA